MSLVPWLFGQAQVQEAKLIIPQPPFVRERREHLHSPRTPPSARFSLASVYPLFPCDRLRLDEDRDAETEPWHPIPTRRRDVDRRRLGKSNLA